MQIKGNPQCELTIFDHRFEACDEEENFNEKI